LVHPPTRHPKKDPSRRKNKRKCNEITLTNTKCPYASVFMSIFQNSNKAIANYGGELVRHKMIKYVKLSQPGGVAPIKPLISIGWINEYRILRKGILPLKKPGSMPIT
jgi:hypothetical protein